MSDRLERFGIGAGALAALLWLIGVFLLEGAGNPAGPSSGEEIVDFYRDDRVAILAAATLHGLGGFLFLWFLGSLRGLLDGVRAPRWLTATMFAGGIAGATLMLALMAGQSTGATTDKDLLTADSALVFWRLAHGIFAAAEIALAAFLGALSVIVLRGFLLPRWLGWFGLVLTIVLLIPPLGWLGLLFLFPLWLIIASVILLRAPRPLAASA